MKLRSYLLAAAAALALAGCGGGSGGGTATVPLSGTAAVGTPLAGATVELRDASGTGVDSTATAGPDGRFTFADVSGLTPPFMLRATGTVAGRTHTLYSFSQTLPTSGVLNATPLTSAVVEAALPAGQTLEGAFAASNLNDTAVRSAELATAIANLRTALSAVFEALGVPANTDPFTAAFAADHTGLDELLDLYQFDFEGGELRVAEKGNPQSAITVSVAAGATAPEPLTAPSAAAADLSLLPSFVAGVNAWLGDANRTRAGFDALVHVDFRDYGKNRDQGFDFFNTEFAVKRARIGSYTVDGCQARPAPNASQIVCDLSFGINIPATQNSPAITDVLEIPVIFVAGPAPVWQFFGNQALLDFSFAPVAQRTGTASPELGISIWMDRAAGAGTFNRADVALSLNGREGVFTVANWALNNPWDDYLVHGASGTFVAVPNNLDVAAFNAAVRAGNAWVRVSAAPTAGGQAVVDFYRVDQELYTAEAAVAAFRSANLQVTWTNPSSVSISGNRIGHICSSFSTNWCSELDFWNRTLSNHVVTPATARAACVRDGTAPTTCNTRFPDAATITRVLMVASENRTDRQLWQWVVPSVATAPVASAEGHFSGTIAGGPNTAFELLILENGEFWSLYGRQTPAMFEVAGFVQGTGSFASGRFSSTDARDFGLAPAASVGMAADYRAIDRTISGTFTSTPIGTVAFRGGPVTWSTYNYSTPATLATVAGAWTASTLHPGATLNEPMSINIAANGAFTATTALGCSFSGTAAPRPSGKNVFNFSLTFGGAPCVLAGQSGTGIAVAYPLGNGRTQLVIAVTNSARTAGFSAFGVR